MKRQRFLSLFAGLTLLVGTLVPFFATYQIPSANAKHAASIFGEKILLCTSEGFRLVSWEDLQNGKEKHKPHQDYQCGACYVAGHGTGIKLDAPQAGAVSAQLAQHHFHVSDGISAVEHWQKLRTRSPPLSFVA